ncbi:MAG: hypothetical protein DWQ47_11095 [Acidobacteria bacterium]|nr:MAG: hypothetical protein DWQ32_13510 [Acidobacteriota bacterium]REJ98125.1 MAG: hypothetical protein DWQ38_16310 [Acidobacteriota bacterium]REK16868.1 MAG: hypothetical protein DWQ43_01355 [Acidobacteriota bacterium]REK42779.1 MAG: hypothetical protein DWQ47_11095 [Acidobacteriota bacterium]
MRLRGHFLSIHGSTAKALRRKVFWGIARFDCFRVSDPEFKVCGRRPTFKLLRDSAPPRSISFRSRINRKGAEAQRDFEKHFLRELQSFVFRVQGLLTGIHIQTTLLLCDSAVVANTLSRIPKPGREKKIYNSLIVNSLIFLIFLL